MSFGVLGGLLFELAFLALVGFVMRKRGIIDDAFQQKLSTILLQVILPFSVLAAGNSIYESHMVQNLAKVGLVMVIYYVLGAVALILITKPMKLPEIQKRELGNVVLLANMAYIGLPIIEALYGREGTLYVVVIILLFQLVTYTWGIWRIGGGMDVKSFFTSPMTLSPIIAILIFISPFRLPAFIVSTFNSLGNLSGPFAMFITGSVLARIKLSTLLTDRYAWYATLLRQVAIPALTTLGLWAAGISGVMACVLVVENSMPSATVNIILAEQYSDDSAFTTRAVVQGTLAMVLTLPFWVIVAGRLFQ